MLNRDLRIFRKNCPVKKDAMLELISPEEAATAEFLIKESFRRLDIAKYTANQNTVLVQSIQKSIPGTQLVPLGQSTTYYQSNGFATKLDQVKALTHSKGTTVRLVDVPRISLFSQLPERYREGIVRLMAEWQVAHKGGVTKSGVVEIVILDKNAEGIVRKELLMPRLEPPKRPAPEDIKALPAPPVDLIKLMTDMSKLTTDQVISLFQNKPQEWILDEFYVEKLQNMGLAELKAKGVKDVWVMRIQENTYPFANRPALFVGVVATYIGVNNPETAKLNIGYGVNSASNLINKDLDPGGKPVDNLVWIWKEDINNLVDTDWENVKNAFNTYYKWGKDWYDKSNVWDPNNIPSEIKGLSDRELGNLVRFMKKAQDYGFLDNKFNSFEDKLEKGWKERIAFKPEAGLFDKLDKIAEGSKYLEKEYAQELSGYALGKILDTYLSIFDQFGGDRRGRRPDGFKGGGEWIKKLGQPGDFVESKLPELKKNPIKTIFK